MTPVIANGKCVGFILHNRDGFVTYDVNEKWIGVFPTEKAAVAALFSSGGANNK